MKKQSQLAEFWEAIFELRSHTSGWLVGVFVAGLLATSMLSNWLYDTLIGDVALSSNATVITLTASVLFLLLAFVFFRLHMRALHITTTIIDVKTIAPHAGLIWILSPDQLEAPKMAMRHHGDALQHVWVILLKNDQSLQRTFDALADYVRSVGNDIRITPVYTASQDVQSTFEAIQHIFDFHAKVAEIPRNNIVADITGGLKPLSAGVVLACATNNWQMEYLSSVRNGFGDIVEGTQRVISVDIDLQLSR